MEVVNPMVMTIWRALPRAMWAGPDKQPLSVLSSPPLSTTVRNEEMLATMNVLQKSSVDGSTASALIERRRTASGVTPSVPKAAISKPRVRGRIGRPTGFPYSLSVLGKVQK
eukprot:3212660-Prymnesium_polylepis.1